MAYRMTWRALVMALALGAFVPTLSCRPNGAHTVDADALVLYVAADGNDAWSGKLPAPMPPAVREVLALYVTIEKENVGTNTWAERTDLARKVDSLAAKLALWRETAHVAREADEGHEMWKRQEAGDDETK